MTRIAMFLYPSQTMSLMPVQIPFLRVNTDLLF